MPGKYDAVVIGAGANGLVAAAALGRAGKRVLLLDRADAIGGRARVREFAPGFRSAPLAIDGGWVPPSVTKGLGLGDIPTEIPRVAVTVLEGRESLSLACDPREAALAIRRFSPGDSGEWPEFVSRMRSVAGFLEDLYQRAAPDVGAKSVSEMSSLLGLGRKFRALGRDGMTELLRVLPMPVHDLLGDAFETELLRAAVGAGGVRDIQQGPRSGGTSFVLLHYLVGAPSGSMRARGWWRDGPDAFVRAVEQSARVAGVEIRTGGAAEVARIVVRDDAVTGVALTNGDEIAAPTVLSTLDPARTLLGMVDPVWLDPEFLHAVGNIKFRGCTAVVQYALDALPEVPGARTPRDAFTTVVSLSPTLDTIERAYDAAKYGLVSEHPHIELSVPTLRWPSLAPAGEHVLIARAQYVPYGSKATSVGDLITEMVRRAVPGFAERVRHRDVLLPEDLEHAYGYTEGDSTQGSMMLDQILFMRPVPGWGRHTMPIDGLFLGGAGTHPGPGIEGGAGLLAALRALKGRRAATAGKPSSPSPAR